LHKTLKTTDKIRKYELVIGGHQGLELYSFQLCSGSGSESGFFPNLSAPAYIFMFLTFFYIIPVGPIFHIFALW